MTSDHIVMVENVPDYERPSFKECEGWCTTPLECDIFENRKQLSMSEEFYTELTTRSTAFPKDGGDPIAASVPGYSKIPFTSNTVTLIGLEDEVIYAKTLEEKQDMAFNYTHILICWPGVYTQDIFYIDDLDALKKALGFTLKTQKTRKDLKDNEWTVS